jgi:hypothetical protein
MRPLAALYLSVPLVLLILPAPAGAQSIYEEVNLAIERGVHELLKDQREDGTFAIAGPGSTGLNARYPMGVTAFAVYALLKSGLSPEDPMIKRAIGALRYMSFRKTYSVSVLILALDALQDREVDPWICKAGAWLESEIDEEANIWAYPEGHPDLSNTQYAALALWIAERHGFSARSKTWIDMAYSVMDHQNKWGGFGYREASRDSSSGAMTTAGIAALTIAVRVLKQRPKARSLRKRATQALDLAWAHLDRCFTGTGDFAGKNGTIRDVHPANRHTCKHFYFLYGLERVAALANRTRIGGRNWYVEGATTILKTERKEGGWGDLVSTSFALLFLRRATYSGMSGREKMSEQPRAEYWRYRTTEPAAGWAGPGFDDSGWSRGAACFGSFTSGAGAIRSLWLKDDIWIRREFEWREGAGGTFRLYALFDDAVEIYVNGVVAASFSKWSEGKYVVIPICEKARAALKKGRNVLAAHCSNNKGGAQIIDVRLRDIGGIASRADDGDDEQRVRWWKAKPLPEVPFIRRWLVLGPLANDDDALLLDPFRPDVGSVPPAAGTRTQGAAWKEVAVKTSRLDFEEVTRAGDRCVYCAATWLEVDGECDAVLWVGADDGVRVLFDNRVILSHHSHASTPVDGMCHLLRLRPGRHSLLFKVEDHKGAASLHARISTTDGKPIPGVRPVLDPELAQWPLVVAAHPGLFSLEELHSLLPTDERSRLDFGSAADLDRVAIGTCRAGYPHWLDRFRPKNDTCQPNPGARGIVALRPSSPETPVRMIRKVRVPRGREFFEVRVSAEAHKAEGEAACAVRLGVFDGTLKWIAGEEIAGGDRASTKNWRTLSGSVAEYADQDVLLIVECGAVARNKPDPVTDSAEPSKSAAPAGYFMDCAFIDDASLR